MFHLLGVQLKLVVSQFEKYVDQDQSLLVNAAAWKVDFHSSWWVPAFASFAWYTAHLAGYPILYHPT